MNMCRLILAGIALASMPGFASAQTQQPYAGQEARSVKALSDLQIADLRAGRGMGLALAAELNGYPGPIHVLELAEPLALKPDQRSRTAALYEAMKAEAVPIGERLIAQETELDRAFASHTINPAALTAATAAIGETQARLRAAHLKYHLAQLQVLTPEQVRRYADLRGYSADGQAKHGHGHHPGAR